MRHFGVRDSGVLNCGARCHYPRSQVNSHYNKLNQIKLSHSFRSHCRCSNHCLYIRFAQSCSSILRRTSTRPSLSLSTSYWCFALRSSICYFNSYWKLDLVRPCPSWLVRFEAMLTFIPGCSPTRESYPRESMIPTPLGDFCSSSSMLLPPSSPSNQDVLSIPWVFSSLGPPVIPSGVKLPVAGIKLLGEGDSGTSGTVATLRNFL